MNTRQKEAKSTRRGVGSVEPNRLGKLLWLCDVCSVPSDIFIPTLRGRGGRGQADKLQGLTTEQDNPTLATREGKSTREVYQ